MAEHGSGVVDKNIDARLGGGDFGSDALGFGDAGKIGVVDGVRHCWSKFAQTGERSFAALTIASDLNNARAHASEAFGGDLPDARGCASDDDYLA
jgi:hypothetical protein